MASTQERDELRRLADELPDDAVHNVLQVARVVSTPFVLDGVQYEIDLDLDLDLGSAERLRKSLVAFIEANGGRLKRGSKTTDSGEASQTQDVPPARERPAWIGAGRLGPDFASRAKDVLRDEMGQRKA